MTLDLLALLRERHADKVPLSERHLNARLVQVLRTLGFDADYRTGEGAHLYDQSGARYLDLLSGFGVFAIGRNHPTVIDALEQVLRGRLAGLVQLDVSLLAGLLAERLLGHMPWLDKLFFCNSGAEAVEAAIKFARAATGRSRIVYCEHGFHGLTYGALSLCGDPPFRDRFGPFVGDCTPVPFDDLAALEQALDPRDVAAFVVEPIQGKGVNLPADDYLPGAARLCRKSGTLLVADEIQTGIGRTGRFLAAEHWAVEPDMVLLAKALSGGFVPIGAVACRREVFDRVFDRMDRALVHGSTFARNDLAMAAGLATLQVLEDERLIERAETLGSKLRDGLGRRLAPLGFLQEVRGKGLMIGLEFGPPDGLKLRAAYAAIERVRRGLFCQLILIPLFREHRILAQVAGQDLPVIKLLPPLVVGETDLAWIEDAFATVLGQAQHPGRFWQLGRMLAGQALRSRTAG